MLSSKSVSMITFEFKEKLAEQFLKKGMPRHCGLCKKNMACMCRDPESYCLWLKRRRVSMKRFLVVFGLSLVFPDLVFAASPTLGLVSPANAVISANNDAGFTAEYNDADGWTNIKTAYIHVNVSTSKVNSFEAY